MFGGRSQPPNILCLVVDAPFLVVIRAFFGGDTRLFWWAKRALLYKRRKKEFRG
jgi:hypothetical protein